MKVKSVEELFGTLQQSVIGGWRKHLKTDKHSTHVILDEFYKEMPELVDKLIEDYMGINDKVEDYINILDGDEIETREYLNTLREMIKSSRELMRGETELESDLDDIMRLIDSTLYKLKELTTESLSDYLSQQLSSYA